MTLFFVDWQIMFMAGILLKKTAYKDSYKKSRGFRRLFILLHWLIFIISKMKAQQRYVSILRERVSVRQFFYPLCTFK